MRQILTSIRRGQREIDDNTFEHIKKLLGLDGVGNLSTKARIQKLQTCVQEVMAFLFPLVDEETPTKHAHTLASLIYSGELFGKEAAIDSAFTVARQVTRAIYTGRILLKRIDLRLQGSMTDSSITEFHQLEDEAGISKQK